jgi:hypothetical protein
MAVTGSQVAPPAKAVCLSISTITFPLGEIVLPGTIHVDAGIVIGAAVSALENEVIRKANPGEQGGPATAAE